MDFQPPENLDEEKIQEYEAVIRCGDAIAPVAVRFDGEEYWLADGFHRVEAAKRCGRTTIAAEVTAGTYEEMEAEWKRAIQAVKDSLQAHREARGHPSGES